MTDQLDHLRAALADRYRIERELGAGGMATVYLAEDLKHHRQVAVKVLHPDLAVAIGAERFLREIEIAANLTHPNIGPLHDSGAAGPPDRPNAFLYYVMPYIEGETLRARIRSEKQLSLDDALEITREVADALSHAHSMGVVHRDIKPENVLLASGHAVVADFGIARAITAAGGERLTETGLSIGTPAYMSPEQAMGEQDVDARSDIYSLGCVAYEMLAGDPPFVGTNPQAILARKTLDSPPRLRTVRDSVPEAVEQPILKALARVQADRFSTAGEFRDALAFTPASGLVAVPGPQRRLRSLARPRVVGLVALLAVVLAVGGRWIWSAYVDARIDSLVVLPFYNATDDPDQDFLAAGIHEALINTLEHVGALRVTSRTSSMRYKGTEKSIPEIARELGTDAVVEASVLRTGDNVNLEVQLIDSRQREVWSQSFDASVGDAPVLYGDVAQAIAREVRAELAPDELALLSSARPVHQVSYEAYLRGMHLLRKGTAEDAQRGLAYLYQAVEDDPDNALAHTAVALGYLVAAHTPDPPVEALPQAKARAELALELDPTLAETMTALAFLRGYYEYEWDEAEQMFQRALEIKPNQPNAHYWWSWQLALFDRMDEAREAHRIAYSLDPLDPRQPAGLGWLHLMEGQWDEAEVEARKTLEVDPTFHTGYWVLAEAYAGRGRHEEAVAVAQQAVGVNPYNHRGWILGRQLALAGRTDEARAIAVELEALKPTPWIAWNLVVLYATLGDKDNAFRWLDYEHPHAWWPWVRVFRPFEPLWDDPRFAVLMERMNLPWEVR